jgi:CubicO group peptidase (beta-lactamase class C family)
MKMRKWKWMAAWMPAVLILSAPVHGGSPLDSLIQTLPQTCIEQMRLRGWPSLSIAVVRDQQIVFSRAFGAADVENGIPATTRTIYRIASMTKLFSATLLMQLAERGVVHLDDPLVKYVPEYKPDYPPGAGPTTLRQLASHTAGLHVDAGKGFWHYFSNFQYVVSHGREPVVWGVTREDLLAGLNGVEIETTPNEFPHYSNFGYQLLGIAMEKAGRGPFERQIQSGILSPLGMADSGFELDAERKTRFAVGYTYLEPDFQRFRAPEWDLSVLKYSGGLCSTPEDIARFISFQFRDHEKGRPGILSGDGLRLMRTPQTLRSPDSGDSYGVGWALYEIEGMPVMAHAGGHWGFSAKAEILRDQKLGVVVMTNCNYPQGGLGPDEDVTKIILKKFIPVLAAEQNGSMIVSGSPDIRRYAGSYAIHGGTAHADVRVEGDTLRFSLVEKPGFTAALLPLGEGRFCFAVDPGRNPMFRFEEDGAGRITALTFLEFRFGKE